TVEDAAREFFGDDRAEGEVATAAAIFLGDGRTEQAGRAGLVPEVTADHAVLFPLRMMRSDLAVDEMPHGIAECLVFAATVDRLRYHDLIVLREIALFAKSYFAYLTFTST